MDTPESEFLSQLDPMALSQMMRQSQIDDQLAQARALRQPMSGAHSTATGAALGGLGDVIRGLVGGQREKQLMAEQLSGRERFAQQAMAQQQKSQAQQDAYMKALIEALRGPQRPQMGAPDPTSILGGDLGGYGVLK